MTDINLNIHPDDDMYSGSIEHYLSCGSQLASYVDRAVAMSGCTTPKILELPCGYGRVTRHLVQKYKPDCIDVTDIMKPAVDFCVEKFNVNGIYVQEPVCKYENIRSNYYDVAVMGSLITHLCEADSLEVLASFLDKLNGSGCAVVTTTGVRAREICKEGRWFPDELSDSERDRLLRDYDEGRFAYVNYKAGHTFEKKTVDYIGESYGISLIPHQWMLTTVTNLGFAIRSVTHGGWDNHQDVYLIGK